MTNTEQSILSQINGSEQLPEEIQLTELLPVEQSRIKETRDDKDPGTTDGLKLLRSFTQDNQDEFDTQNFKLFRKIDNHGSNCNTKKRVKLKRGRNEKWKDMSDNEDNEQSEEEINIRVMRNNRKVKGGPKKKALNSSWDNEKFSDEHEDTASMPNNKNSKRQNRNRQKIHDKDYLNDEVYYYRQQYDQTPGIDSDENETNIETLKDNVFKDMANNFLGANASTELDKTIEKHSIKKKNDKQLPLSDCVNDDKFPSEKQTNDNDLQLEIGHIIKSNYLLEPDNNNTVECESNQSENLQQSSPDQTHSAQLSETISTDKSSKNKNKKSRNEYTRTKNNELKKYCCLMCDAKFKGSGGLRNHWKVVHASGPSFKCDDCGKEFPLKERLKLHVRTHTGFKPYKCTECDKTFARGGQLSQHRRTHSHVKPYHCSLCSGTFTCSANLALHMKRHNGQKDHKCEICGREFIRRDALKKHLECLHKDVKSFLCVICNKTFKGHLPQHMRTHCQERPHGCATCGQRFAQKSQLTVHQRTHSGQRPFRCLVCWQAFAHSTALKLHTRRHTGERPFKCTECSAGFTQLPHWKKHMKCIHGRSKPYCCKNCNSFFRIKNDLENHEKTCLDTDTVDENGDSMGESSSKNEMADANTFRIMSVEKMRLLLAVLLKRISKPLRLVELGFGKRLIDEILQDSLVSAGKEPAKIGELTELETLRKNLKMFLEWTVPKEHWEAFKKMNKSPEEILETLTAT
ncbi:hypothetical protein PV328_009386 [Microctonus aethiopoides]|uniref:C2H2-type domain-containing protein n=1 Tax=Microctonus aethiopoides TaxID=144406 RepID=A0AA39C5Q4_9HYME|nr:hypothetical protein PV328_009386 [Microctonus aethiopoides]